jgi:hypothetical protein
MVRSRIRIRPARSFATAVLILSAVVTVPARAQSPTAGPSLDEWMPQLQKGLWVKVEGEWMGGVLRADELRVFHGELDQSEVTSVVASADSASGRIRSQLGVEIVVSERTEFQKDGAGHGWSVVAPGVLVEADGQLQRDGTLLADELEIRVPSEKPRPAGWYREHELTGRIDAIDLATHTLTVLGVTVRCDARTRNKTRFIR